MRDAAITCERIHHMPLAAAPHRSARRRYVPVLGLAISVFCASCDGGYVPPEAINPPTAAFAKAVATMGATIRKDLLAGYRRDIRDGMIATVIRRMAEGKAGGIPSPKDWLCQPDFMHNRKLQIAAAVEAKGKLLDQRAQASPDDLGPLFSALARDYAIVAGDAPPETTWSQWLDQVAKGGSDGESAGSPCLAAFEGADPFKSRPLGGRESATLEAGLALLDVIWEAFKVVVPTGLKNIDMERRAAAIRAFLADQRNVDALARELKRLEAFVESERKLEADRAAGRAIADLRAVFDPKAAHWKAVNELVAKEDCTATRKALLEADDVDQTDPNRVRCVDKLREAIKVPIAAALDSADRFDLAMAKAAPSDVKPLSDQLDTLRDVASGKSPPDEKVRDLWAAMLRYASLGRAVVGATSDANVAKIDDAWTTFVRSLER